MLTDGDTNTLNATGSKLTCASNDHPTEGDTSTADKPKKRARFSRRDLAKSEPASRLQDSHDGQQDSDVTAVSSGEGQPLLQPLPLVCSFVHFRCLLAPLTV